MKTLDYLGLSSESVQPVVKGLAQLLADMQVYYTNLRGFHWNIQGKGFFVLHEKFEALYTAVAAQVDEVAERMLQLGSTPENRFSEYLKQANLEEVGAFHCADEAVKYILESLKLLIEEERRLIQVASEINDDVTVALIGEFLNGQEKQVWMLTAFLNDFNCKK